MRNHHLAACAIISSLAAHALAQAPPPAPPQAPTTVQLPTFSFFTVQTAVSVPDGGGAYLGGIHTARDGSLSRGFGPLRNRASGSERGASSLTVHATIIDLRELDEAILAEAAAMRGPEVASRATEIKAELMRRHVKTASAAGASPASSEPAAGSAPLAGAPLPGSVAAIRAQNAVAREERAREAADLFARGQRAEGEGKPGVAKVYYRMVTTRVAGDLRQAAQGRLAALEAAATAAAPR